MTERWICARCFTSAEANASTCPNCGLERSAQPESAAGDVAEPESQARPDEHATAAALPEPVEPVIQHEAEPPAAVPESAPVVVTGGMAAAPMADAGDRWVCRQCFYSNEGTAAACANCGLARGEDSTAAAPWAAPGQAPMPAPRRAVPWRLVLYGVIGLVVVGSTVFFAAQRGDTGEITGAGDMSVFDLAVGDCFDVPDAGTEVDTVRGIPCDQAHTYEVFWTEDYPGDVQPGEDEYMNWLQDGCLTAFESYVGVAYADSVYYMGSLSPTTDSWSNGDRAFTCYAYNASETSMTGSVQGTAE